MDKKYRIFREVGKVAVNFGNLTFASLILGTIIKGNYERWAMLLVGAGLVLMFVALGIIMLTKGEES